MSYCRFGPDSNVYVYMSADDRLHCCWCHLVNLSANGKDFAAKDRREMVGHLREHLEAGHRVPAEAIADLESESEDLVSR
jgi:hypothetical protein